MVETWHGVTDRKEFTVGSHGSIYISRTIATIMRGSDVIDDDDASSAVEARVQIARWNVGYLERQTDAPKVKNWHNIFTCSIQCENMNVN